MKPTLPAVLLFSALLALAHPARAELSPLEKDCLHDTADGPDETIAACMATIKAAGRTAEELAVAHFNRGTAYEEKGQIDRALADYSQAIKLVPAYAEAYYCRGLAYFNKGQYDLAITDFDQAIKLAPAPETYLNRGAAYHKKGLFDRAIEDFDKAIEQNPNYADAFNDRGNSYQRKGQYDRAIEDFDKAIKLNPDYAEAYNNRGITFNRTGAYDRAIADFDKAVMFPNMRQPAKPFANRGFAYLKKGTLADLEHAIADSEKALKLNPHLDYARRNLDEARTAKEALLSQAAAVKTGRRIALVIGNSVYANESRLPNAAHDAEDVAAELKKVGYEIFGQPKADFAKAALELEIDAFRKASEGAAAAVVWYSGHGRLAVEKDDPNLRDWIIPVDAQIKSADDVGKWSLSLDSLKYAVVAAKELRLVVVDACRETTAYTGLRGTTRFLDPEKFDGVVIVYSTSPGDLARDGTGRNSPFAQAFLELVREKPRTDVRQLFGAVTGRTKQLTGNPPQRPIVESGLETGDTVALGR